MSDTDTETCIVLVSPIATTSAALVQSPRQVTVRVQLSCYIFNENPTIAQIQALKTKVPHKHSLA